MGVRAYGRWKVAGSPSFPPDQETEGRGAWLRLENGQRILLRWHPDFRWDPRGDGRYFYRAEVRSEAPPSDKAILAALCVLEGTELSKKDELRQKGLNRIRRHLRGEEFDPETNEEILSAQEDRMVAFVRTLLWFHRPDLDQESPEGIEVFVETCDRVARVTESARQLADFLEFGSPDHHTRRAIEDAQMAIFAAELRHIAGMNNREIAERVGLDLSLEKERSSKQLAASRAQRGVELLKDALGDDGWSEHRKRQRSLYYRQK